MYWNHWIEDDDAEQPGVVQPGAAVPLSDRVSSLDFAQWTAASRERPAPLAADRAETATPLFKSIKYNVLILPIGSFTASKPFTVDMAIDRERLKQSLVTPPPQQASALASLAKTHGALKIAGDAEPLGVTYEFALQGPSECAALAVIITNVANGRVVAAWTKPLRLAADLLDDACGDTVSVSRRMDLVALFDYIPAAKVAARLTFLEVAGQRTIGIFVDLRRPSRRR